MITTIHFHSPCSWDPLWRFTNISNRNVPLKEKNLPWENASNRQHLFLITYYTAHRHCTALFAHHIAKFSLWTKSQHYWENKEMSPHKSKQEKTMPMWEVKHFIGQEKIHLLSLKSMLLTKIFCSLLDPFPKLQS